MNNAVLAATAMSFGERAGYAARMLLIGLGTVFVALIILWGVLVLFRLIVEKAGKKNGSVASPSPTPAKEATEAQPEAAGAENGELIAVITAAVAAALAEENGGEAPAFRVVSFRKMKSAKRG